MGKLLVYTSSAGSGKTFTLAKEYLKIVLKNPSDFRNILAVTFTNKSTEEMKTRIIEYLRHFAGKTVLPDGDGMKTELLKSGVSPDEMTRAKDVLKNLLHNYTDFYVMTIDSFFSQVVKSFAKELNLPSGFDYEIDESTVIASIVDEIWQQSSTDDELLVYLVDLMKSNMASDRSFKIDDSLKNIAKEIFKDRFWELMMTTKSTDKIFENVDFKTTLKKINGYCSEVKNRFETNYKKLASDGLEFMNSLGLGIDDFYHKKSGVYGKLASIITGDVKEFNSYYLKGIIDGVLAAKKSPKEKIIISNQNEIIRYLNPVYKYYQENIGRYFDSVEIQNNLMMTGLFADLYKNLQTYKEKNSILLISDVSKIIRQYVDKDSRFTPFIFEKFGSNFKNILIDEFQDTSTFQWDNLKPLVQNSISENHNSMIVGDAKQSIYRFRNGNMELLVEGVGKQIGKDNISENNLGTNRRSLKNIVDFNNNLFRKIAGDVKYDLFLEKNKSIFEDTYKTVEQIPSKAENTGIVNVTKILKKGKSENEFKEKAFAKMLEITGEIKEKLISTGKYNWSDITILVTTNKEASQTADVLIKNGYNVVSANSLLLASSPKVKLIINVLKLIADRQDRIANLETEYHYKRKIENDSSSEKLMFKKGNKENKEIFNVEMPEGIYREGHRDQLSTRLYDLNTLELVEYITDVFGLNKNPDMYLLTFMNEVKKFASGFSGDLISFLLWWEENSGRILIETEMSENAIQIQTIHKMKGLQNKIIIIPLANWDVTPRWDKLLLTSTGEKPYNEVPFLLLRTVQNLGKGLFSEDYQNEMDKSLIDNINLLYVALTRPKEMLYVITQYSKAKEEKQIREKPKNISDYIVQSIPDEKFKEITEEIFEYESGSIDFALSKPELGMKESGGEMLDKLIYNDWYKKIVIKPKNHLIKPWDEKYESISFGNAFHDLLSEIIYKEDADDVLDNARRNGLLDGEKFEIMKQEIYKLLDDKTAGEWFTEGWEILTERDILTQDGKNYRPDRVMYKNDKAIVIDYKTGSEKDDYNKQISNYAELLKGTGFTSVEKYLLYIKQNENKIVKVD